MALVVWPETAFARWWLYAVITISKGCRDKRGILFYAIAGALTSRAHDMSGRDKMEIAKKPPIRCAIFSGGAMLVSQPEGRVLSCGR